MARKVRETEIPYREVLKGILSFSSFAKAEQTLGRLRVLSFNYQVDGDRKGVEYCRHIAFWGRRRAELISRNKKVCLQKRLHKKEVATWFQIWLETPELFDDWLLMRKKTAEFRELLKSESCYNSESGNRNALSDKTGPR